MISLNEVINWLKEFNYLALFPLSVIEGPIVTVIAGFFASLNYINFYLAYAVVVAGDLAGDILHYWAGRYGGRGFIKRFGKYFGLGQNHLDSLENQFAVRGDKLLFIGKMTHGIGGAFLIAAGLVKMPFTKFFFSNMLATLLKSLILLLIGFYFGQAFTSINNYLQKIALISTGAAFLLALVYFFYFRKKEDNDKTQ